MRMQRLRTANCGKNVKRGRVEQTDQLSLMQNVVHVTLENSNQYPMLRSHAWTGRRVLQGVAGLMEAQLPTHPVLVANTESINLLLKEKQNVLYGRHATLVVAVQTEAQLPTAAAIHVRLASTKQKMQQQLLHAKLGVHVTKAAVAKKARRLPMRHVSLAL